MSLINEALKKAQHQRTGSPMDAAPMPGGGSGAGRRGQSMPTGTLVLLIAGATVVIVISVVATVYFVNRAPAVTVAAVPAVTQPVVIKPAAAPEPSPVIIAPVIVQAPPPVVELPSPPPPVVEAETPVAAALVPEPVVEGSLADRIAMFIDKVHVMGIRASGTDNKVLMNDHVYRINDIVDRKLGLRLVKIAGDSLTFADANGVTYVKSF